MKKALWYAILLAFGVTAYAQAHQEHQTHQGHQKNATVDLKTLPASQQVEMMVYCQGAYEVKLTDSTTKKFKEFDLRFKTDSSPNGPNKEKPVLIPAGMGGDRAFVIFSDPTVMATFFKNC